MIDGEPCIPHFPSRIQEQTVYSVFPFFITGESFVVTYPSFQFSWSPSRFGVCDSTNSYFLDISTTVTSDNEISFKQTQTTYTTVFPIVSPETTVNVSYSVFASTPLETRQGFSSTFNYRISRNYFYFCLFFSAIPLDKLFNTEKQSDLELCC